MSKHFRFWHDFDLSGKWFNFTFISLSYDRDGVLGTSEIHVGLLGLCMTFVWTHDEVAAELSVAEIAKIEGES